jgi:chemotaxis protein methyltransferase CheR
LRRVRKVATATIVAEAPDLMRLEREVRRATGLWFPPGLRRSMSARIAQVAMEVGEEPAKLVARAAAGDRHAIALVAEQARVGETWFFRQPEQFDAVARLLPRGGNPLLHWSAGCATGEEAYSMAIALAELGRKRDRVLGTDLSERALAHARVGAYGDGALRRAHPALERRHLGLERPARVARSIRAQVDFQRHNLVADEVPWACDVVFCRNVLAYFEAAVSHAVLGKLFAALRPGGLLVLGSVELPLAAQLPAEWIDTCGTTVLRKP